MATIDKINVGGTDYDITSTLDQKAIQDVIDGITPVEKVADNATNTSGDELATKNTVYTLISTCYTNDTKPITSLNLFDVGVLRFKKGTILTNAPWGDDNPAPADFIVETERINSSGGGTIVYQTVKTTTKDGGYFNPIKIYLRTWKYGYYWSNWSELTTTDNTWNFTTQKVVKNANLDSFSDIGTFTIDGTEAPINAPANWKSGDRGFLLVYPQTKDSAYRPQMIIKTNGSMTIYMRQDNEGPWTELAATDGRIRQVENVKLDNDEDLNNFLAASSGKQFYGENQNSIRHKPEGVNIFSFNVYRGSTGNRVTQVLTDSITAKRYIRTGYNFNSGEGTEANSGWKELATTDNKSNINYSEIIRPSETIDTKINANSGETRNEGFMVIFSWNVAIGTETGTAVYLVRRGVSDNFVTAKEITKDTNAGNLLVEFSVLSNGNIAIKNNNIFFVGYRVI